MSEPQMTERQAKAWPEAVAEVAKHATWSTVPDDLRCWIVKWDEETRPGRGHAMDAVWCDGEYFAQIRMDVYGYPSVSVASVEGIHSSCDEDCPCDECSAERLSENEEE